MENLCQGVADGRDEGVSAALDVLAVACIESNSKIPLRFDDGVIAVRCVERQDEVAIFADLIRQEGWRGRRARWTLCTYAMRDD